MKILGITIETPTFWNCIHSHPFIRVFYNDIEAIKLILFIYNNFSIFKKVVKKINMSKDNSKLSPNMKLIYNKLVFIKHIKRN